MTPSKADEKQQLGQYRLHPGVLTPALAPVTKLKEHPENPRRGDTEVIGDSMRRSGVYRPIYAQKSTGYVLGGNHTFRTLKEGGAAEVPVIWLDVDDEEARVILLSDNGVGQLGGFDDRALFEALSKLDEFDGTGYDEAFHARLAESLMPAEEDLNPGEFPEYGQDIETHYGCPSCGYQWSGNPNPGRPTHLPEEEGPE